MESSFPSFQFPALERVSDAVIVTDLGYVVRYWNAAAERIYGWPREEVLGRNLGGLFESDLSAEALRESADLLWTRGVWRGEVRQKRKDGKWLTISSVVNLLRDEEGEATAIMAINRDLSPFYEVYQESHVLRQHFNSLASQVSSIVLRLDLTGHILYINRSSRLEGTGEILGKKLAFFLEKEDGREVDRLLREVVRSRESRSIESFAYQDDGEKRWFFAVFTPEIVGEDLLSILVVAEDITKRKREELKNSVALRIGESFSRDVPDLQAIFAEVHGELRGVLPAANMYIALLGEGGRLELSYYSNTVLSLDGEGPPGLELSKWVLGRGKPVLMRQGEIAETARREGLELPEVLPLYWMAAPLINLGEAIGLIALQSYTESNPFRSGDLDLLAFVAGQIGSLLAREIARKALVAREKFYRAMLENSADLVFVVSESLEIRFVSPSIEDIGYRQEELIGMDAGLTIHPGDRERVLDTWRRLMESPGSSGEVVHRIYRKDGTVAVFETKGRFIPGSGNGVINCREITSRLEAEERNRVQAEIIQSSYDAIVGLDRNLVINSWNRGAELILGYGAGEVIGTTGAQMIPEGYRERDTLLMREVLEKRVHYSNIETVREAKDGRLLYLTNTVSPVLDPNGELIGVSVISKDLTGQKRLMDQLNQSLAEKDVLLKEVHHRVKNNLQIISSLLLLEKEEISDPGVRSVFVRTEKRIRALFLMHEKLYQSPDLSQINFREYLEDFVGNMRVSYSQLAEGKVIEIECGEVFLNINEAIPCAMIVNELLSNSLKHAFGPAEKGRIWIKVVVLPGDPSLGLIEVGDSGPGLAEDFEIERTMTLGLSLVKALSLQIRGELGYKKEDGSVFLLRFPLSGGN